MLYISFLVLSILHFEAPLVAPILKITALRNHLKENTLLCVSYLLKGHSLEYIALSISIVS